MNMTKPCKVGRMMPIDKTTSDGKTASGMAVKLRTGVASDKASDVARGGMPTEAPLTMRRTTSMSTMQAIEDSQLCFVRLDAGDTTMCLG
jgi:hypothetical protein